MSAVVVIPARYASTRLPGKPLADIGGKPMIRHVYERAARAHHAEIVVVATDDRRVIDAVTAFGGQAQMTSPDHASGTDRIAEVTAQMNFDSQVVVINVQGDEPLIRPQDINILAELMDADQNLLMASLCCPLPPTEAADPNTVKVVTAHNGDALYFSRAPIPYPRDAAEPAYFKHIGIYAYRVQLLAEYASLPPSPLEELEKLEQLRVLQAGITIRMAVVDSAPPGVDTPEDLERIRTLLASD